MIRYIFTSLIILSCLSPAFSQEEQRTEFPQLIIKYTPTATFNIVTPGFQIGLEHHLKSNHVLQYELGILSNRLGLSTNNNDMFGYRLRLEYRKYRNEFGFKNKFSGWVFETKQRFLEDEYMLGHPETNYGYVERLNITKLTSSASIYYTRGIQRVYNHNFTLEIAAGIGGRYLYNSVWNKPDGLIVGNLNDWSDYKLDIGKSLVLPVGFLSVRIGYILK